MDPYRGELRAQDTFKESVRNPERQQTMASDRPKEEGKQYFSHYKRPS